MRMGWVLAVCVPIAAPPAQRQPRETPPPTAAQQAQRFARELELPARRAAAVDALLLLGADAVPALMQQARHPDLAAARTALQIVAALAHDGLAAVPELQRLAEGDDAHARAAAWTLARLPHRGTLLAPLMDEGVVIELDAQGKEIWRSQKVGRVWAASVLANGNLLAAECEAGVREYDPAGKLVAEFTGNDAYAAERLIDGNTLVASYMARCVQELDGAGNEVWSQKSVMALYATRLPNGLTLISDAQRGTVAEVDRAGEIVWELGGCGHNSFCHRHRDGSTWVMLQQAEELSKFDRDGTRVAKLRLASESTNALPLPDGTIQSGNDFVRRCDAQGKERWRATVTGWVGRITLR